MGERVAAVDSTENGPAPPKNARDVAGGEHPGPIGLDEPVEAVLETDDLDAVIDAGLHDGADHGVQAWRVATPRQNPDALQLVHAVRQTSAWLRKAAPPPDDRTSLMNVRRVYNVLQPLRLRGDAWYCWGSRQRGNPRGDAGHFLPGTGG